MDGGVFLFSQEMAVFYIIMPNISYLIFSGVLKKTTRKFEGHLEEVFG